MASALCDYEGYVFYLTTARSGALLHLRLKPSEFALCESSNNSWARFKHGVRMQPTVSIFDPVRAGVGGGCMRALF